MKLDDYYDIPSVLDLLAHWQSIHTLLPERLKIETEVLNQRTLDILNYCCKVDGAKYQSTCE